MDKKPKAICIFTIVYLLLTIMGLTLFGISIEKVPINSYGLRRNFFSSFIEQQYYPSGLYHKEIGFYFINFPSSNQYLTDISLNVTNSNMETVGIVFTLVYQLKPDQIYNLYQSLSSDYEQYIVGSIKGIISNYFMNVDEENRAIAQQQLVSRISTQFGNKIPIIKQAVQIKAFWLNQYMFYERESQYEEAYLDTSSQSQAYEQLQIQLQKTLIQVDTVKNSVDLLKQQLNLQLRNLQLLAMYNETKEADRKVSEKQIILSQAAKVSQIFKYYKGTKLYFT